MLTKSQLNQPPKTFLNNSVPLVLCTNSASIVEFEKNHGIVSYNADGPITTEFLSIAQLIVNGCSAPIIELSKFDKRKS